MKTTRKLTGAIRISILMMAMGSLLAPAAQATNGYFSHGYGTASKAMAGVGAALQLDSLSVATNPAAIAGMDSRLDLGISLFSPQRGYTVSGSPSGACLSAQQCTFGIGSGSQDSDKEFFPIPHIGKVWALDEQRSVGLAMYGNGGMNTRYTGGSATFGVPMGSVPPGVSFTAPGTFGDGTAGVDLMQLFLAATYARQFDNGMSLGITPILVMQNFEARGLGSFAPFSSAPNALTDNGHDTSFGFGVRFGIQVPLGESVRFGAAFQTPMWMDDFDDYAGLFAEQGGFDIPANATVGLAFAASESLTLAIDVQWIDYDGVNSIGNPMLPNLLQAPLGADAGAGFGWDDMTIVKLGAAWKSDANSTWMFGYSQGDQPIDSSEVLFNVLAPGVVEQHFTFGYEKRRGNGDSWTISVMVAPSEKVRGINPLDPAQRIEFEMNQFEVGVGYRFGG